MADKYKPGVVLGGTLGPVGKFPIVLINDIADGDGTKLKDYIATHGGGALTAGPGIKIEDNALSIDPTSLTVEQVNAFKALLGLSLTTLTITVEAREGGQTITVTELAATGLSRVYRIDDAGKEPAVTFDADLSGSDWHALPDNGQVIGDEGQIVSVADITSDKKARAYGKATLPEPLPPQLYALTVTAVTRKGGQTVTVDQSPADGELRRYRITDADAKPTVAYDQVLAKADGWAEWPDNGQVTGTAGQVITVVHVTTQGAKARAIGTAVLPAPSTGKVESVAFTADTPVAGVLSHDYTLGCMLTPADADDQAVTWTSSDTTIADFTKVGAQPLHKILTTTAKAGTTRITVTTHDGNKTAEMTFTNSVAPTGIEVTPNPITMRVGETLDILPKVLPDGAYQGVTVTSDNPDIVAVADKTATADQGTADAATVTE